VIAGGATDVDRVLAAVGEAVRRERCILFLGAGVHCTTAGGIRVLVPV
jgi:hypothetical protein